MGLWIFRCFLSVSGRDLIGEWVHALPQKAQLKLQIILQHLRDSPVDDWVRPFFAPLEQGIFEVRFKSRNVLFRLLGFFGPRSGDFTFLVGAREHGDRLEPRNSLETAQQRRQIVLAEDRRSHECTFEE